MSMTLPTDSPSQQVETLRKFLTHPEAVDPAAARSAVAQLADELLDSTPLFADLFIAIVRLALHNA